MKIYSFIAAVAVCALFVSCSNDDAILTKNETSNIKYNNDINRNGVQNDSLIAGDPFPPKSKDE